MKTAILFPGQGSQESGMGRDLAEAKPSCMDLWELAEKESGLPLRDIYWTGDDKDMADTRALQPALTVVNLCLWFQAKDKFSPFATAGHSLGEFSALCAAGVLSVEDTVRAVTLRGRLMSVGSEGQGMAAVVKLPLDVVEEVVVEAKRQTKGDKDNELSIANYNSPAQFVLTGHTGPLAKAGELVKGRRGRAIPLAVSRAFHSPLNNEAAGEFEAFLADLDWKRPDFPIYFDATGMPETNPAMVRAVMIRQMTSSVYWLQIMDNMWSEGVRRFVEVGPKNVLTRLAEANLKDKGGEYQAVSLSSQDAIDAL